MPKNIILLFGLLRAVCLFGSIDNSTCLRSVYSAEIGVRELTGKNDGQRVEEYLKSVRLGKGYAWCAAFVKWCFDRCGIKTSITAWSPTAHNSKNIVYFHGRFEKEPIPGDVMCLWSQTKGRIAHTGFFDKRLNSSIFESVEGNTNGAGSFDGNGVYRKKRSFKSTYSITRWQTQ